MHYINIIHNYFTGWSTYPSSANLLASASLAASVLRRSCGRACCMASGCECCDLMARGRGTCDAGTGAAAADGRLARENAVVTGGCLAACVDDWSSICINACCCGAVTQAACCCCCCCCFLINSWRRCCSADDADDADWSVPTRGTSAGTTPLTYKLISQLTIHPSITCIPQPL